jgi:hypothetical protein
MVLQFLTHSLLSADMQTLLIFTALAVGSAYSPANGDASTCTDWKLISSSFNPIDTAAMDTEKAPTGIYKISDTAESHTLYIYDEKGWQVNTGPTTTDTHTWNTRATGESDYPMYDSS